MMEGSGSVQKIRIRIQEAQNIRVYGSGSETLHLTKHQRACGYSRSLKVHQVGKNFDPKIKKLFFN
jgi:hypothetical protein